MTEPNIANLYRRHTRQNGGNDALPSADALLALTEGDAGADAERLLADVGRFGLHADLLRLARDLAPESARLGVALEQTFDASRGGHRRTQRPAHASRSGWMRVAASLAAGLVVAVAVWVSRQQAAPPVDELIAARQAQRPDHIFAATDARPAKSDLIFRTEFSADEIFRSKFSGG